LQSPCFLYNLSMCILLFFSYISSLLLLFFWSILLLWSNFQYHISELEGIVYCIVLFLFYLQFSVVYVCCFQMVIQFVINVHFVFMGYKIF
jgi:hypothetical protein